MCAGLKRRLPKRFEGIDGIDFMPEAPGCRSTFWLTALTIDPAAVGRTNEDVRLHLESLDIESRPVWKPMHLQPLYQELKYVGGHVSDNSFTADYACRADHR